MLKRYCTRTRDYSMIHAAIDDAIGTGEGLHDYLFRHVTRNDYPWARLEADGIPCNVDTFRIYRHRFYHELNKRINGADCVGVNDGKTKED